MREYFFVINELPDLSLAKYTGLDNTGAAGVISRHSAFLKQLHTIGELSHMSFHIFYAYDAGKEKGSRLTITLCLIQLRWGNFSALSFAVKILYLKENILLSHFLHERLC